MTAVRIATVLAVGIVISFTPTRASAECTSNGSGAVDGILIESNCETPGASNPDEVGSATSGEGSSPSYRDYAWNSVCVPFDPTVAGGASSPDCAAARDCDDPAQRSWELWGHRMPPEGGWELLGEKCLGGSEPPPAVAAPRPQVTEAVVLRALRRIGLPQLEIQTQPAGKTLVNFETIFYTDPESFTRSITLLGQSVDVEATPSSFTWHHGDGSSVTTTSPGAPYPSKEITHEYTDAHVTVSPRVDVTYTARFRVNGGSWQDIADTVTITGPAGDLRIAEATAVLSGEY